MNRSFVSADTILETANSVPRPIALPSAAVGYVADLIINIAKQKVTIAGTLEQTRIGPSGTASSPNQS
jgi:hypothetical protein